MKLLVRLLIIVTMIIGVSYVNVAVGSLTTREDELNEITTLAMSTTQISAREQIEDRLYGTQNARCRVDDSCYSSNEDYINDFKRNIKSLITTNSVYEVDVYGIDYEKGLLDLEVKCSYKQISGAIKTLSVRKTSIVEVIGKIKYNE